MSGVPLAIEQARAMIKQGISVPDFLGHYESQYQKVMDFKPERSAWDYEKNMSIISVFNMILARNKRDGNNEKLLAFMSCFGPRRVPVDLMGQVRKASESQLSFGSDWSNAHHTDEMIWVDRLWVDRLEFQVVTGQLESLCALKRNRDSEGSIISISLHDSITRWRFETLTNDVRENWILAAAYALSKCLPRDVVDQNSQMRFLPLVRHFYNIIRRYLEPQNLEAPGGKFCQQYGTLMTRFAQLYPNSQYTVEGESVFSQAISYRKLLEESSWPKGRRSLLLLQGFAMMLSKNGKTEDAVETTEALYDASMEQFGVGDEITCWAKDRLPALRRTKIRNAHNEHRVIVASHGGKLDSSTPGLTSNESPQVSPPRLVHEYDEESSTRLRNAAMAGDIETLTLELDRGADINDNTRSSFTALSEASHEGHAMAVRLLLDRGADVNARNRNRSTALHEASYKGHLAVVETLLRYGADVKTDPEVFGTALQQASSEGHIEIAELLLSHGADTNPHSETNSTPLHEASWQGHLAVVELLLNNGADVNVYGQSNDTALFLASVAGHVAVVEVLLKNGAYVDLCNELNYSPLHAASSKGHVAVIELLLKNGADVNISGELNTTALHEASQEGHTAVVELLLSHGANVDAQTRTYGTALQIAAGQGLGKIVELLLNKGADINAQHGTYGNALSSAARRGDQSMVELLLAKGADVNANHFGVNALHVAIVNGHWNIVQLFIGKGADVNARSEWGTPLYLALFWGHSDLVGLLKAAGARDDDQSKPPSMEAGHVEISETGELED